MIITPDFGVPKVSAKRPMTKIEAAGGTEFKPTPERYQHGKIGAVAVVDYAGLDNVCPSCGLGMLWWTGRAPAGMPPRYEHTCSKCGDKHTLEGKSFGHDWTGDFGTAPQSRAVHMGTARKDTASSVRIRLAKFHGLEDKQIKAAVRFETDWGMASLEPKMIVDLGAAGGGRSQAITLDATTDARTRVQAARTSLRRAGSDCLRIVEGVVILEATVDSFDCPYAQGKKAAVYVKTMLSAGLNLLAAHYRLD